MKKKLIWYALALFLVFAFVAPALSWLIRGAVPQASTQPPDLIVLYDDVVGEESARRLAALLENTFNVVVEIEHADSYPVKFRVYPVVVVAQTADVEKLRRIGLTSLIVEGPEHTPMLPYDYILAAIYQYNLRTNRTIRVHYLVNASAYLVNGYSPTSRINQVVLSLMMPQLMNYLSALFGAKINAIVVINATSLGKEFSVKPLDIGVLPAVIVKVESDVDLSRGTLSVKRLHSNLYTLDAVTLRGLNEALLTNGVIDSYEVAMQPPSTAGLIALGSPEAKAKMVVYWDYLCPFSARFAIESLKSLVKAAKEGKVQVFFADLVVHQDAIKLHQLAHCIYSSRGAEAFVNYTLTVFNETLRIDGNRTKVEQLIDRLEAIYGIEKCSATLESGDATRLEVRGTPTVVAWREGSPWLEFIVGLKPVFVYEKLIEWLSSQE